MSDASSIEWTEATWNPIAGCSLKSPGCTNCYAMPTAYRHERMSAALGRISPYAGLTRKVNGKAVWTGEMRLVDDALTLPLRWTKPRRIFVNSMSDLFHEDVPDEWIDRVFAVMAHAQRHTFQVLTKRSARMRAYLARPETELRAAIVRAAGYLNWFCDQPGDGAYLGLHWPTWPLPNVWLGVSAEDQRRADERVPDLLATPAAVRFVSAEPLLGPIDFTNLGQETNRFEDQRQDALRGWVYDEDPQDGSAHGITPGYGRLDWIIVGGESGPGARPMHPDWARQIRDACAAAEVAFHFKQHGAWAPEAHGTDWMILGKDGDLDIPDGRWPDESIGEIAVSRVGKKVAGRLLDGVEYNGFPGGGP